MTDPSVEMRTLEIYNIYIMKSPSCLLNFSLSSYKTQYLKEIDMETSTLYFSPKLHTLYFCCIPLPLINLLSSGEGQNH